MSHPKELASAFEAARLLHKKHGKSYYFATKLFPRDTRLATYALYAFFRVPDEIVDNSPIHNNQDLKEVKSQLNDWRDKWREAYDTQTSDDSILRVTTYVFHRYKIPYQYSEDFLAAMTLDLEKSEYATYAELESYMYGSAAVVGLMMSHVIGFSDERALDHAKQLGYAMQLTNFLRDIDEDFIQRGRVYMPRDELAAHGLSMEDIAARRFSPDFKRFMQWQSERARSLYRQSDQGIPMLNPHGRFPVRVAGALYGAILDKIEQQDWNIFAGRAKTSTTEKLKLAAREWRK